MGMAKLRDAKSSAALRRSRYTVDLPCILDDRISQIAVENHLSKAEVIRDAVRLLLEYDRLKKDGFRTGGWKTDAKGNRETAQISVL
jgi:hypothetical protein